MRDDHCALCGLRDITALEFHHAVIPKVLGGPDDERNLLTLCGECHGRMHGRRATDALGRASQDWLCQGARANRR